MSIESDGNSYARQRLGERLSASWTKARLGTQPIT
jgi:hypothetical protein